MMSNQEFSLGHSGDHPHSYFQLHTREEKATTNPHAHASTSRISTESVASSLSQRHTLSDEEQQIQHTFEKHPLAKKILILLQREQTTVKSWDGMQQFNAEFKKNISLLLNMLPDDQLALILPTLIKEAYFFRDLSEIKCAPPLVSIILEEVTHKKPKLKNFIDSSTIQTEGIELIMRELQAKSSFPPDKRFHVCDSIDAFGKQIQALDPKNELPVGTKEIFFIRCQGGDVLQIFSMGSMHIAPAYMEKTERGWSLILPTASNAMSEFSLIAMIAYRRPGHPFPFECIKEIYLNPNDFHRQADNISCPVFAIRDLIHLFRSPDSLSKISQGAHPVSEESSNFPLHGIVHLLKSSNTNQNSGDEPKLFSYAPKDLPLEMMVYSQVSKIYRPENPDRSVTDLQANVTTRKKGVERTTSFEEKVEEHKRAQTALNRSENDQPQKSFNMHIADRAAKYIGWIVRHVFTEPESGN